MTDVPLCYCQPPIPSACRIVRKEGSVYEGKRFFGCAKYPEGCSFWRLTPPDYVPVESKKRKHSNDAVRGGKKKSKEKIFFLEPRKVDISALKVTNLYDIFFPNPK